MDRDWDRMQKPWRVLEIGAPPLAMSEDSQPDQEGQLTGPKPKEIKVETFRINYLIRSPKVEKLGFEPGRQ